MQDAQIRTQLISKSLWSSRPISSLVWPQHFSGSLWSGRVLSTVSTGRWALACDRLYHQEEEQKTLLGDILRDLVLLARFPDYKALVECIKLYPCGQGLGRTPVYGIHAS